MQINGYHAHLYYKPEQVQEAKALGESIKKKFGLTLGTFHEKPIGPHIEWNCGICVPPEQFAELIPWLVVNRGQIDCFIHPVTGDDLTDHTKHAMWLGKSYALDISRWIA